MNKKAPFKELLILGIFLVILIGVMPPISLADVYINVMAVNGAETVKDTSVKYNLPGDLASQDILETNGLDLDYNVNDANYYVHGKVILQPKESKTFRIRVRDIWKISPTQVKDIQNQIEQGYEQVGKLKDAQQGQLLKDQLLSKLNFIQDQSAKTDTVERRIDTYRAYSKELQRIENSALAVDYWRSDPSEVKRNKIIRFNIEVENPLDVLKPFKNKHYLPSEIKPEDLVEFEGFEVRFDQEKKQAFLFREEELQPKEKKKYSIGIRDIWFIAQRDIDYLRNRSNLAYGVLQTSKFGESAKILFDHIVDLLKNLETSQAQKRDNILDHISAFRDNQKTYDTVKTYVESLEKLLAVYREDLQKSKVQNVLEKLRSLKGISDISKAIFNTPPTESATWKFISWVLIFVVFLTTINFIVWFMRSKDKVKVDQEKNRSEIDNKSTAGKN